jgi:hypothetical protein
MKGRMKLVRWIGAVFLIVFVVSSAVTIGQIKRAMEILHDDPPAARPPRPNAFDDFIAAGEAERRRDDVDHTLAPLHPQPLETGARRRTQTERENLVRLNEPALAALRKGLRHSYAETGPSPSFTAKFPYYARFRSLTHLLAMESDVRRSHGDGAGSTRSALDAVFMGAKIENAKLLTGMFAGIACQTIGRTRVWRNIEGLDAKTARSDALGLEAMKTPNLTDLLGAEKDWDLSALRFYYHHPKRFNDEGSDPIERETEAGDSVMRAFLTRALLLHAMLSYDNYMEAYLRNSTRPSSPHPPSPRMPLNPLTSILVSVFEPAMIRYHDNEIQNRLLSTAFALQAYRKERGRYPEGLQELVPRYLHRLPEDYFADGKSLRYQKRGERYRLYSVGPDGRDDGGRAIQNPAASAGKKRSEASRYGVRKESRGDIVAGANIY